MQLRSICWLLIGVYSFISCSGSGNFLVEKGNVGGITSETTQEDLTVLFENDSVGVVESNGGLSREALAPKEEEYIIYSKSGEKLLKVSFKSLDDLTKKVSSVQLLSADYETKEGISLASEFEDILAMYKIGKIETTLTSATLFIDELNATISIDKQELGLNIFSREKIVVDQIPANAKIKFITIWFE